MCDRYTVALKDNHRFFLRHLLDRRRCSPTTLIRARILVRADAGLTGQAPRDEVIAREVHASPSTVYRVRRRFVERGLRAAIFSQAHAGVT
jgi:Homeodomain-like domain